MKTMTETQLFNVPVPTATESYSPVSHEQIVTQIRENVDKSGLKINNAQYQVARDGLQVIGVMDVEAESDIFNYRMAFRNSYNKTMSLAFVAGTSVMICSNGMVVGDTKFIRKHTGTIQSEIDEKISRTIGDFEQTIAKSAKHAEQMKNIDLSQREIAELCGRWFMEQEILRSSQLNIIKQQLINPDHEEFSHNNLWSIYNHATHALKKTAPDLYIDKYKDLHNSVEADFQLI